MTVMVSRKEFRHLVSAMLYVDRHIHDKDLVVDELHTQFKNSPEPDPVVWLRSEFKSTKPYPDGINIRNTFTALTYREAKSNS